eukprot:GHVU01085564.1.p1 GENE.GHVU01085564.1~~GHVU01085564.1.p1  ORF type:complete len:352 (-),score=67.92 GHVU01085564.1:44-1099(-)
MSIRSDLTQRDPKLTEWHHIVGSVKHIGREDVIAKCISESLEISTIEDVDRMIAALPSVAESISLSGPAAAASVLMTYADLIVGFYRRTSFPERIDRLTALHRERRSRLLLLNAGLPSSPPPYLLGGDAASTVVDDEGEDDGDGDGDERGDRGATAHLAATDVDMGGVPPTPNFGAAHRRSASRAACPPDSQIALRPHEVHNFDFAYKTATRLATSAFPALRGEPSVVGLPNYAGNPNQEQQHHHHHGGGGAMATAAQAAGGTSILHRGSNGRGVRGVGVGAMAAGGAIGDGSSSSTLDRVDAVHLSLSSIVTLLLPLLLNYGKRTEAARLITDTIRVFVISLSLSPPYCR